MDGGSAITDSGLFSCSCGALERRSVRGGRNEESAQGGMECEDEGRRTQRRESLQY